MATPRSAPQVDPVLAALDAAPLDDEPVTAEDREAIAEGRRQIEAGETASHEIVRARWLAR